MVANIEMLEKKVFKIDGNERCKEEEKNPSKPIHAIAGNKTLCDLNNVSIPLKYPSKMIR